MQTAEIAQHVSVKDAPDGTLSVIQIKDAFLNYATSDDLMTRLKEMCRERVDRGVRSLAIDLTSVTVMDSCGLSMLIAMKKIAGSAGGSVCLFGLSPMVRRLFGVTKLESVFLIRDDEVSALDAMKAA
jgi:anti-sigma B factor antagonist